MKKQAMLLGFAFCSLFADELMAGSVVDFSGYYRAYVYTDNNYSRNNAAAFGTSSYTAEKSDRDNYFQSRFHMDISFQPTDEIGVFWQFRGPFNVRWGAEGGAPIINRKIYGRVVQDWGTLYIGKFADMDNFGLASLGYKYESVDGQSHWAPFDSSSNAHGIKYTHEWDNGFGLVGLYEKVKSDVDADSDSTDSDVDHDRFTIEPRYLWDGGGASLALEFSRNYTAQSFKGSEINKNENMVHWGLNPALSQTWGNFALHFEGKFVWGEMDQYMYDGDGNFLFSKTRAKGRGMGLYLDGQYDYGPGHIALAGWLLDGNKIGSADGRHTDKSLVDLGNDFYALEAAHRGNNVGGGRWTSVYTGGSASGLANNATTLLFGRQAFAFGGHGPTTTHAITNNATNSQAEYSLTNGMANHWALALRGAHTISPEIKMHYTVAYLSLLNANYRVATAYDGAQNIWTDHKTQSKDMGVEVDLAISLQLLDNLYLTSSLAYMFNGDAYKSLKHYQEVGPDQYRAVWSDPNDTYSWVNTLSFYF
ncbi:hypothetical protein LJB86_01700 [Deltaproteobacteria bacterium OttesenSCG-928-M10]|nr:hypothetical protein [Deltaproteobacteria bacterium OttesenSCG-928-M10]